MIYFRVTNLMATHAAKSASPLEDIDDHIMGVPLVNKLTIPLAPKVRAYVEECVKLCKPDEVYICDGSEAENNVLLKMLEKKGTVERLPKYENW